MEQVPILSKPGVQERETVSVGVPLRSTPPATDSQSGIASLPVMLGLDAPVSPCYRSDCPPPARLSRGNVRRQLLQLDCQCKLPYTVLLRISRIKTGACRGLRPCPLCHLCPATATADAVAASGPKQHRPSDERPLQPRCEVQRHHPPEGSCRGYINLVIIHYLCTSEVPLSHLCGEDVHGLPASSFGVGSRFSSTRVPYACLSSKHSFL